ncbi:MAG: SBBP repeat-containing protein [Candidatus Thorarchaeota archaeon]
MRGKRILLPLVLVMLSVGLLHLSFHPTSLGSSETVSDPIDEKISDSLAQNVFLTQFYENIGQLNTKDVLFYGRMPGGMIGFGESRIHLWMEGTDSCVFLSFVGADDVMPVCTDEVSRHNSYFLGDRGTYTGIRGYSQITYEELWPGIDLYYHATIDGVKYEFHVAAGRNPTDIRVQCEGHDSLVIGESVVRISKDNGTIVDEGLLAFQNLTDIDVTFSSHDSHTFGFNVGDYDGSHELIIDPLVYSTFIGGSGDDGTTSVAVDSSGNAFVAGYTSSSNFPAFNAYNSTYGGEGDCFVFKLSADGSALVYSVIIGGCKNDMATSVAVDPNDNAYVTGQTDSPDFPTVNSYDNTKGNEKDCFVFKLSPDGSTLLFSTYIGGDRNDRANCIAIDFSGNAFVAGYTSSSNFPIFNAYNSTYGGEGDCFVFKLSADGSTLHYTTFIGGGRYDEANCIAIDLSGNAYVTGETRSPNFPTINAYNSTYGGNFDCFVLKLSANGSTLYCSTFIGGSGHDEATSVAVDSSGNAFVAGYTSSPNFPTFNAYNSTYGGEGDCFVFKLSPDGSTLLYSTYIGGDFYDWAASIAVDRIGNAYIAGVTSSSNFPTLYAYNQTYGGGLPWWPIFDCFVIKLSKFGSLLYSTYIGGWSSDEANCITVDAFGYVYVTGHTYSEDFPTAEGCNSTYSGGQDCFVLKLSIPWHDDASRFHYAVISSILQLLQLILHVFLRTINLVAWGIVLMAPIYAMTLLMSRMPAEITETSLSDYEQLTCQLCSATYLYGSQHMANPETLRCQNCDREFLSESAWAPQETVRVSIAYMLLSRLRESRWSIFRRKKESE